MKHLLAALGSQSIPVKTEEHALKKLLADVHKHRGEVKASETWEEQLESALVELRGNEHAGPFLKPVKRTEAPDYDKVIKHPMDLQTMGKKVRQRLYTTKKQFSDDLYLIWENCLSYNSDPNHVLRRFARNMKTQTDHVLARIPDRRERTMESLIETFKFEPKPVPKPQIVASPPPPDVPRQLVSDDSSPLAPTPTPLTNGKGSYSGPLTEVSKVSGDIIVPKRGRLKDRPTLERTVEGMSLFTSLDVEMDAYIASLSTRGAPSSNSSSMMLDNSLTHEHLDHRLHAIIEEDDELVMWKEVPVDDVAEGTILDGRDEEESDLSDLDGEPAEPGSKKRKRSTDRARAPRKRVKLEKVPQSPQPPIDSWWQAVRSTSLLSNGMPPSFDSPSILNPRYHEGVLASTTPSSLNRETTLSPIPMSSSPLIGTKKRPKKKSKLKSAKQRTDLLKLIGDNNITRRRARALYGQVTEQIEEAKQAVDPDEIVTTIPEPEPIPRMGNSWAQRASLGPRRRDKCVTTDIGPKEAQDAMEWMSMMVLEHANFDSSSTQAIQTFAGVAGEALMNLGRALKILQEVQGRKMNAEEMILHALFANGISSVYELEYYIKNDIVKNSLTLNSIESQLSETKKEEVASEDALFDGDGDELIGGSSWADYTGEDVMGLKDSGIAAEFGLVSLTVPRRLWKPKKVAAAKQSVDETETVRYPPPPPFIPVQTKSIDKHIGLLRHYYQDRITKLALPAKMPTPPPPPPPPPIQERAPPTSVAKEPTPTPSLTVSAPAVPAFVFDPYNPSALAIGGSSLPAAAWSPPSSAPPPPPAPAPVAEEAPQPVVPVVPMGPPPAPVPIPEVPEPVPAPLELPPTLEDDLPDPARVKVGPLGQIQQISASAALKQKRAAAKLAATGGSAAAIAAGLGSVSSLPKPAAKPKPKKPKEPKESKTTPKKASKKAAAPPTPVAPTT